MKTGITTALMVARNAKTAAQHLIITTILEWAVSAVTRWKVYLKNGQPMKAVRILSFAAVKGKKVLRYLAP